MVDPTRGRVVSVLHVVAFAGSRGEFGGPVSVAEAHARELLQRGHSVLVTGLRRGPEQTPAGLTSAQWRTFPARRVVPRSGMLGLSSARFLRFLWSAVRRVDVVHVHAGRDLVSLSALLVARLRAVPVVAQTHGMVLPRRHLRARLFDPVFLRLMRHAHAVFFMTQGEHDDLRTQLGPSARLRFLGNGVELPTPRPRRGSGEPPMVLFLARLHPVKRVAAFAEMAAVLARRGIAARYRVHGPDQGDLATLHRLVKHHGLDNVLAYGGALSHDEALAALHDSAVYVLPSSADWMPMSLLEALAAGVPSVCTDSCGLAVDLHEAGAAVVTDGSPESLADAVGHILLDPPFRRKLSRAAREVVSQRYSVGAVVDELERVYAEARIPVKTSVTSRSTPPVIDRYFLE